MNGEQYTALPKRKSGCWYKFFVIVEITKN